jgi:hypothetical protein
LFAFDVVTKNPDYAIENRVAALFSRDCPAGLKNEADKKDKGRRTNPAFSYTI